MLLSLVAANYYESAIEGTGACLSDPAGNHGAARAAAVGGRDNIEAGGEARKGLGHIVAHGGLLARDAVLLRQRLRQPRPCLLELLHK